MSAPDRERLAVLCNDWAEYLSADPARWPAAAAAQARRDLYSASVSVDGDATAAIAALRQAATQAPAVEVSRSKGKHRAAGRAIHGLPRFRWAQTRFWLPAAHAGGQPAAAWERGAVYETRLVPALLAEPTSKPVVVIGPEETAAEVRKTLAAAGIEMSSTPGAMRVLASPDEPDAAVRAALDAVANARQLGHRLSLITRGNGPESAVPAAVLRAAFVETPEIAGRLVSHEDERPDAIAAALFHPDEPQLHLAGGEARAPRLAAIGASERVPARQQSFRADRAYVVTGGFGSVGLHLARWLAERGAGHIVLMARSPPASTSWAAALKDPESAAKTAAIAEVAAAGAEVSMAAGDVTDPAAFDQVVAAAGVPLGGIVHAAGLAGPAGPAALAGLEGLEGFARQAGFSDGGEGATPSDVLRPKILGSQNAAAAVDKAGADLLLFVSSAGVWGGRGLGVYAAANAYMDRLAEVRRSRGLPALSVQFGGWEGSAMLPAPLARYQASQGFSALKPARMLALLDEAMATDRPVVAAVDVDLSRYGEVLAPSGLATFLREDPGSPDTTRQPTPRAHAPLLAQLEATHPARRQDLMLTHLTLLASQLLSHADEQALRGLQDEPFTALGFNSLVAMEFADTLSRDLGTTFSPSLTFEHPTLRAVAEAALPTFADAPEPAPEPAADSGSADDEDLSAAIEAAHAALRTQLEHAT
ncbi:MAG: beta-ketoacyl reductase [Pseudomonadota bacterium]